MATYEKKIDEPTNTTVTPALGANGNGVYDAEKQPTTTGGVWHAAPEGVLVDGTGECCAVVVRKSVLIAPALPEGAVHRQLKQRHMTMIALGGAIGTGGFWVVQALGRC